MVAVAHLEVDWVVIVEGGCVIVIYNLAEKKKRGKKHTECF